MHQVDEFAEITATMAVLNERRNSLRERFLRRDVPLRSNRHEILVRTQTRRVLDRSLLPSAILDDPRYVRVSECPVVSVRPIAPIPSVRDTEFDLI